MYREEKAMVRTLLDLNFVNRRKFDDEQDKNDRGSNWDKTCFMFCGASPYTLLATLASLSRTDNPDSLAWKCMIVMWCMWKESNG